MLVEAVRMINEAVIVLVEALRMLVLTRILVEEVRVIGE